MRLGRLGPVWLSVGLTSVFLLVGCPDPDPDSPEGPDVGTEGDASDVLATDANGDGDDGGHRDIVGDGDAADTEASPETAACEAGRTQCDDACVDTSTDPDHCGACGNVCEAPENAAVVGCQEGACRYTCDEGWRDANDDLGGADSDGCETAVCEPTNGGVEVCDGDDNDCDGREDEVCPDRTTLVGGENTDRINAVAAGSSGLYVGGTTAGPFDGESVAGNFDAFVARIADDGSVDWLRLLGVDASERIDDLAVGPEGAVYAVGSGSKPIGEAEPNGGSDALLAKYDREGNRQWVRFQGSDATEFGHGIDVSAGGEVAVGYQSRDPFASGGPDGKIARWDTDGTFDQTVTLGEDVRTVDYGPDGKLAVGGRASEGILDRDGLGGRDGFVALFLADGSRDWVRLVGGEADDIVRGVTYAGDAIYATGATASSFAGQTPEGRDAFVARIDDATTTAWVELAGGSGDDVGRSIARSDDGTWLVAATVASAFGDASTAGESDVALLEVNEDGKRRGEHLLGTSAVDEARSLAVTPNLRAVGGRTEGDFDGVGNAGAVDGFVTLLR